MRKTLFTLVVAGSASALALTAATAAQAQQGGGPRQEVRGVGASIDVEEVSSEFALLSVLGPGAPISEDGFLNLGLLDEVWSAKFVCGQVPADEEHLEKPAPEFAQDQHALTPGTYLTAINVFNPLNDAVAFTKAAVEAPAERVGDGTIGAIGEGVSVTLGPGQAIEIDCVTINEELLGEDPGEDNPVAFGLRKGFVRLSVACPDLVLPLGTAELLALLDLLCPDIEVTAVYTYKNVEETARGDGRNNK